RRRWTFYEAIKDGTGGFKMELLEGIGSGKFGRIVVARISIGVDFLEALHEVVRREKIKNGIILMGIGALQKAVFRNVKNFPKEFPLTPQDRVYFEVRKPLEIVSLTGYIVPKMNGEPHIHAHFSASTVVGEAIATYGGHLDQGSITSVKVAVVIGVLEDIAMGKKWVEERKGEDLWVGSKT
ncbi:MAG: DNA-binding protein, partial [Deltaproteobacteria bacterium]|nr:DNA-binding protein [Deltaproteobacteria bacterium]